MHAVGIWLQPAGPASAVPLDDDQPRDLELLLPEFGVALPFLPTDFTQVNHRINEVLVSRALRLLAPNRPMCVVGLFLRPRQLHFAIGHARAKGNRIGRQCIRWSSARAKPRPSTGWPIARQFEMRNLFELTLRRLARPASTALERSTRY